MRLDLYLVEKGFAPSRTKAQELIRSGSVEIQIQDQKKIVTQASYEVSENVRILILENEILQFVSRGGLKLSAALKHLNLSPVDFRVLDIGQSTGGFTDALLQAGVAAVIGIDVGHAQLHHSLKNHPKVISLEGIHVSHFREHPDFKKFLDLGLDLIVVDVSFISILTVLKEISQLKSGIKILGLIKPQFEVGKSGLGKGGIVKSPDQVEFVLEAISTSSRNLGLKILDLFPCAIVGGDGNQEYFLYAELV